MSQPKQQNQTEKKAAKQAQQTTSTRQEKLPPGSDNGRGDNRMQQPKQQ